jgi:voltage-gated potassium channel Kch
MEDELFDEDDRPDEARIPTWARHSEALRAAFRASDSYSLLLVILLIDFLLLAALPDEPWVILLRAPFIVATLLLALRTSHASPKLIRLSIVAGGITFSLILIGFVGGVDAFRGIAGLFYIVLLAATPLIILRRILTHDEVTVETIMGALCVYLLIGIVFSTVFVVVNSLGSEYFASPASQNAPPDLLYLSFVTLTTVGFGDVVPATDFGRSIVILEALIGQIFLVTLVARLFAGFGQLQQHGKRKNDSGD